MEADELTGACNEPNSTENLRIEFNRLQAKYESECAVRRDLLNQLMEVKGNIRVLARIRPLNEKEEPSPLESSDDWTIHAPLAGVPTSSSSTVPVLTTSLSAPTLNALLPGSASSSLLGASSTSGHTGNASSASNTSLTSSAGVAAPNSLLNKKYQFDRVFGPGASQSDIFEEVSTLSTSLLDGYNCCLFAYGQTGSGKTFTMEGSPNDRGLTYRILSNVFEEAEKRNHMVFEMQASVLEIYNEALIDLLDLDLQTQSKFGATIASGGLKLRQGERGICVPDATKVKVNSWSQIESVMETAKRVRSVASTDMNEHSSRSHCVTCLEVCGRRNKKVNASSRKNADSGDSQDVVTFSRLFLIDLAGSERIAQSGAQGKALDEAKHINKSLSALARVMECLQLKRQHIPFRDSTLTYLLKDSLIDAKTVMMLNLSPAAASYGQSVNSLNFGVRVRKIERAAAKKNFDIDRASYNSEKSELENEIKTLKKDVQRLTEQLSQAKSDFSAETQQITAKNTDTISQLKAQMTQMAQTHATEMASVTAAHEKEVAALKKALAEAKLQAAQAKALETVSGPTLQKTASLVLPRPNPTVIAASIVSQQLHQPMLDQKSAVTTKETQESVRENENKVNAPSGAALNNQTDKDKYVHQTTPIKPRALASVVAKTPQALDVKHYTSPGSSKLASPIVVVDELQKMYLKHQKGGTSERYGLDGEIPMMDENGILLPVVMTPQLSKRTTITMASPIGFSAFDPDLSISLKGNVETSIIDDDSLLNFSSVNSSVILTNEVPSPSVSPAIEAVEKPGSPIPVTSSLPPSTSASTISSLTTSTRSTNSVGAASTNSVGTSISTTTSKPVLSTSTTQVAAKLPLKSCLMDRKIVGRVKKTISFAETDELFGGGDPMLPIRRLVVTLPPSLASNGSSAAAANGVGTSSNLSNSSSLSSAAPSSAAASRVLNSSGSSTSHTSMSAVRPPVAQPASPIKSVAVRPISIASAGPSMSHGSVNPGPRRVVAKHTSNLQVGPKATPARIRPSGRTGAPLSGPTTVYKTY